MLPLVHGILKNDISILLYKREVDLQIRKQIYGYQRGMGEG